DTCRNPTPYGSFAQKVNQYPRSFTKPAGRTIRMKCDIKSSETVHWYQSKPNKPITRILYRANSKAQLDEETPGRFSTEAPSSNQQVLVINNVLEVDSATYYCAYWDSTVLKNHTYKIFGTGTKLLVTDRSPETPKIQVFRENDKSDTEFLLVCLITGFYPDVIKVYWKPDGEQSKWETDPVEKENGETSYVISRFNVTQLQWKNSKVICGVQHESSKDNIEVHANGKKTSPKGTVRVSIAEESELKFQGDDLSSKQYIVPGLRIIYLRFFKPDIQH
uniref:Ig-like domain-containing protein n=1 Tax=Callorhinchus milii TaxID=7868 RepID=A0A4W3JU16_CALMI